MASPTTLGFHPVSTWGFYFSGDKATNRDLSLDQGVDAWRLEG